MSTECGTNNTISIVLLTIFTVYQLCSHFPSTATRMEETGLFTKTGGDRSRLPQLCICFFLCTWLSKCSDQPTMPGQRVATYQLSPPVKVLLLSSNFFSTASSSTAVCSKSAETESWGQQEIPGEDATLRTHKALSCSHSPPSSPLVPAERCSPHCGVPEPIFTLCSGSPTWAPPPTAPVTPARVGTRGQDAGRAWCVPGTCKGPAAPRLVQQVHCPAGGRREITRHLHRTTSHIPQLPEEQSSVSI